VKSRVMVTRHWNKARKSNFKPNKALKASKQPTLSDYKAILKNNAKKK
jgi:hypothetical protein